MLPGWLSTTVQAGPHPGLWRDGLLQPSILGQRLRATSRKEKKTQLHEAGTAKLRLSNANRSPLFSEMLENKGKSVSKKKAKQKDFTDLHQNSELCSTMRMSQNELDFAYL